MWRFIQIGLCFRNISMMCRSRVSLQRFKRARDKSVPTGFVFSLTVILPVHDYLPTILLKSHALGLTEICTADFRQVLAVLFACPFSELSKGIHVVALRAIFSIIRLSRASVWKYGALALACPFHILGNLQLTSMLPQC